MRLRHASLALGVGRDLFLAVLVFGVVLLAMLSVQLGYTEEQLRERSLDEAAQYVSARLQPDPDGVLRLPSPAGSSWAMFGYPVVVFDRDGKVLYQRPALDAATLDLLARQRLNKAEKAHVLGSIRFFNAALGDQDIIGAMLRVGSGPEAVFVTVFKDENAPDVLVDDVVRGFPYRSLQVMLPILALLLIGGGWVLWHRMRPIARVSAIARTIGPSTLNVRLPENDLPAEVQPIVHAVNGAFERLERAAAAQREFMRRAAHHLRTPLTVLSARADSLDDSETGRQLRADVRELARTISQLLELNDIEGLPEQPGAVADLAAIGEAVRDGLARQAAKRDIRTELRRPVGPVLVDGDPNVIEVAIRNLVENAIQHSPAGAAVEIAVKPGGCIEVADAGPGIAAAVLDRIFEPFWSGDLEGARAGLGLTIVHRIAERYGGTVTVEAARAGGAVFAMTFVPAPASIGEDDVGGRGRPASLMHRQATLDFDVDRAAG